MRIDAAGRPGAIQAGRRDRQEGRPVAGTDAPGRSRALTVVPHGRTDGEGGSLPRWQVRDAGRPEAGFVIQLILATDPALWPARVERARAAAALYAQAAERLG